MKFPLTLRTKPTPDLGQPLRPLWRAVGRSLGHSVTWVSLLAFAEANAVEVPFAAQEVINNTADIAFSVYVGDVDGDLDVVVL